jgi:diphthine-ammonia ligase
MYFAALLSGGKDSCFNVMKCVENGHILVCLANLMPADHTAEEVNSFMYQSAGHSTVPLYASCFGVPLYRKEIIGSAVSQKLNYEPSEEDEVEDLYMLLVEVKRRHPEVQAISCGAIISNYQRTRLENVCIRLGLTPLTYLWMLDRSKLLDSIISDGVEAILVKVAGAGLLPEKHLGKSLGELRPVLRKLNEKYGLDLCGEGGEYESLVLDCPIFRTHRINLVATEVVLDEEDPTVGNLRILEAVLVSKGVELSINTNSDVIVIQNTASSCKAKDVLSASAAVSVQSHMPSLASLGPAELGQTEIVFPDSLLASGGGKHSQIIRMWWYIYNSVLFPFFPYPEKQLLQMA